MGLSFVEIVILIFFGSGGLGIPVGMPPGDEDPLMSRVAPPDCLFFTTWTHAVAIDAQKNPTEAWMAQPEIQRSFQRLQLALDDYFANYQSPVEYEVGLSKTLYEVSKLAISRSASIYLTTIDISDLPDASLSGGILIDLGEAAGALEARLTDGLRAFAADEGCEFSEFSLGDRAAHQLVIPDSQQNVSWSVHRDRYLMIGFGDGALQSMSANLQSDAPQWLEQVRARTEVERVASVSYVNGKGVASLVEDVQEPGLSQLMQLVAPESVDHVGWTTGLDEQGYVMRTEIAIDGKPSGLLSLFDGAPLATTEIARIPAGTMMTAATRLSSQHLLRFVRQMAEMDPAATFDQQLEMFNQAAGIDFEQDVLDHLSDTVFLYGSISPENPTAGWVLGLGVRNEMQLDEPYGKIIELIKQSSGPATIRESQSDGVTLYTYQANNIFLPFNPSWAMANGEVLFSLDEKAISGHLARNRQDADRWVADPRIAALMEGMRESGPVSVSSIDVGQLLQTLIPLVTDLGDLGSFGGPDAKFGMHDLPDIQVVRRGLLPNISAMYRTERGFELIQRQVLPGGSPAGVLSGGLLVGVPLTFTTRREAARAAGMNDLRQFALAMHNYESAHRAFPAQFSKDADGKPLLSWRVHILPYLDEMDLYREFHLDEPWDSDHNKALIEQMPEVFNHPRLQLPPGKTVYVVPVGEDGLFSAPEQSHEVAKSPLGTRLAQVTDGLTHTILILEVDAEHAVNWTEPSDYAWEEMESITAGLKGVWPDTIQVAFCDGSVRVVKPETTEETWKKLLQKSDGQIIDFDDY